MPRPKAPGAPEPKKRSRTGCWTCKSKKVKCGEEKPRCANCDKNNEPVCDYSIRLNWEGRSKRKANELTPEPQSGPRKAQHISVQNTPPPPGQPSVQPTSTSIDASVAATAGPVKAANVNLQLALAGEALQRPGSAGSGSDPRTPFSDAGGQMGLIHSQLLSPGRMEPALPVTSHPVKDGRMDHQQLAISTSGGSGGGYHRHKRSSFGAGSSSDGFESPLRSGWRSAGGPAGGKYGTISQGAPSVASATSTTRSDGMYENSQTELSPLDSPPFTGGLPPPHSQLSLNAILLRKEGALSPEDEWVFCGTDRGMPDYDIPRNNDARALDSMRPKSQTPPHFFDTEAEVATEFGFGLNGADANHKVIDYSKPIPVKISKELLPLPSMLVENPMNLLYFHFFQEFTAKILVPHDCPENPFKNILPRMALQDENLLHLLLAYSASHRARLLEYKEPSNRIAIWVKDVFPHLRHALSNTAGQISNSNLATSIMLASLEIVAPSAFEVDVPWQDHLKMARSMIVARGGPGNINRRKDRVSYFLIRWFAYLDILGNFSSTGPRSGHEMFNGSLYDFQDPDGADFEVDCVLGFSGALAATLASIADLARRCDALRVDPQTGAITPGWGPEPDVRETALRLRGELEAALQSAPQPCPHRQRGSDEEFEWDCAEIRASSNAFARAGRIHLERRVLGRGRDADEVQAAVRGLVEILQSVRKGGSTEACLLFPLFTAGCEAVEPHHREIILERIESIEGSGMTQVQKARQLMEQVWKTGRPWETLVNGQFFG